MFCHRIKQLRLDNKLSQEELSKKLNLSRSTVNMYERGEREPDFNTLNKIATFFDVSVDYLLGNEENYVPKGYVDVIGYALEKRISADKLKKLIDFLESVD